MDIRQAEFEKTLQELQVLDLDDPRAPAIILHIGKMTLRRPDEPSWDYAVIVAAMPEIDRFLSSNLPYSRECAIDVLIYYWKSDAHVTACEHMAQQDPDEFVRSLAVICLGVYYKRSKNTRILGLLNTILRDDQEIEMVRAAAYSGILSVGDIESQYIHSGVPDPIRAVDWQLVDAIVTSGKS